MESSLVDGGAAVLAPEIMEELGPAPLPHSPPALRPAAARPLWEPPSAATRGQAATRLRESIFRRMLLLADVLAICGSLLLTVGLYSHALPLPPGSVLVVALLLVAAKVSGLYDRDDTLLRKTTLEELPRLFQLATLGALAAWLSGGLVLVGAPSRAEGLFLWLTLAFTFVLGRTLARALALRLAPVERCMFIGPADVSETVACKLSGHGGIRARLVAVLDFDEIGPWSAQAQAIGRLAEIRELARTLDVQRAIVAPRGGDAAEVLDLVRTLKAVGVRVSILPRVLEVVGSSVEFDDLHGVTVMGVRRFHLTRSSAAVKRSFDLILASLGLVALAPLMALVAIAIK